MDDEAQQLNAKAGGVLIFTLGQVCGAAGYHAPDDWDERMREAVVKHGDHVVKQGRGPGSLEEEETAGLDYIVLNGIKVGEYCPWFVDFYTNPGVAAYMSALCGEPVEAVYEAEPAASININLVVGQGGRYEWHTDSDPYTCLLYVTTHSSDEGGELAWQDGGELDTSALVHKYNPVKGQLLIMDAAKLAHAVLPLANERAVRISAPMHFRPVGYKITRDDSLNDYLFSPENASEEKEK